MENCFFVDSEHLSSEALAKKHRLEKEPTFRTNHMEYMPCMEVIKSDVCASVMAQVNSYDYSKYTSADVKAALEHSTCTIEDFKALLSPAAEPFLEQMAERARLETSKHFGNTVYLFTPLYIANYCENYCVYCGFNCYNHIKRMKLNMEQIEKEMQVIADSGMEEILILTGESRAMSDVKYIGEACKLARKYFRMVGLEIYPVNTDEYRYLHECGADYVTVFQETYDTTRYEQLHLLGHKRVWPYRFDAQERALRGGMRGVFEERLLLGHVTHQKTRALVRDAVVDCGVEERPVFVASVHVCPREVDLRLEAGLGLDSRVEVLRACRLDVFEELVWFGGVGLAQCACREADRSRETCVVPPVQESPRSPGPFQRNLFSLHGLDFHGRIDSQHGGTWDSPVG